MLHWGGAKKASTFPSTDKLLELGAQQIIPSDGHCLVLTAQGTVYDLSSSGTGGFTENVSQFSVLDMHAAVHFCY